MAVKITLVSNNVAGGGGAADITTNEYADSTAAVAAVVSSVLPVTAPLALDGTALKKRHIPLASILEIVSL